MKDLARSLGMRDAAGDQPPLLTEQWVWSLCAALGFGDTDRQCRSLGLDVMREKAAGLADGR